MSRKNVSPMQFAFLLFPFLLFAFLPLLTPAAEAASIFAKDNLVAWCIVPFDAAKRGPEERAKMLADLGIHKLAYDWRDEHIPTFEAELDALKKHNIELTAFWIPIGLQPQTDENARLILDLLKRKKVKTQIWITMHDPALDAMAEPQRVAACAKAISFIAGEAAMFDSQVALYNHGGWFGEPENQIQIIQAVGKMQAVGKPNVGIVYNFHHAHERLDHFKELLALMKPYLIALNINGERKDGPMIIPLGQGDMELELLRITQESGYAGPIGILDHRPELDAIISLQENLDGMKTLVEQLGDQDALKTY